MIGWLLSLQNDSEIVQNSFNHVLQVSSETPNPIAKAELNLLAHLVVGGGSKKGEGIVYQQRYP